MRRIIAAILLLTAIVASGQVAHVQDGSVKRKQDNYPRSWGQIANFRNLSTKAKIAHGWYPYVAAVPTPGYVITAQHDQINASNVAGIVDSEITQAEYDAQQEAAHQEAKPETVKEAENNFILLQWQIMGVSSGKYDTAEIRTKVLGEKTTLTNAIFALPLSSPNKEAIEYIIDLIDLDNAVQDLMAALNVVQQRTGNPSAWEDLPDELHEDE